MRRVYRPLGCEFVLDPAVTAVADAVRSSIGRYGSAAGVGGRVRLATRVHEDTPSDPAWPEVDVEAPDATHLIVRCGSARLSVDAVAGEVTLDVPHSLLATPDAMRTFVETSLTAHLVATNRLSALHSGLVVSGGTGLMLRGASGAGKSTLSYACVRRGMSLCSDDWLYAVSADQTRRLWGHPWRLMLLPDARDRFPELADVELVVHPSADRWKAPVAPPVRQRRRSAEVHAVVFLDPATDLDIRAIDRTEAIERWWSTALPTERRDVPPALVERLTEVPCFVMQRGTDPNAAAARLARLRHEIR